MLYLKGFLFKTPVKPLCPLCLRGYNSRFFSKIYQTYISYTFSVASDTVTGLPNAPYSCRSPNTSMRMD